MRLRIALIVACGVPLGSIMAQTAALTRADAIQTALGRGARLGVARADTSIAAAALVVARARPNPSGTASYSKSTPTYHFAVDIPLDFPMLRALRIRSAQAGLNAAQLRYQFSLATIAMDADTSYTRAVAARERLVLSRRNALDADSLLHIAERRRDAGDASDMDVELARVNAGQQVNLAADDSLTMISAMLDLQSLLGMKTDQIETTPTDSLTGAPEPSARTQQSLDEMAAALSLDAATLNAQLQHHSVWSQFSLSVGFETGDPSQRGILPTVGVGVGLPFFDRNRGAIAEAEAERTKAQAELAVAQIEAQNAFAHATRERASALAKVNRDVALVASATRVASLSLTGYREGALTLANVLEAQRTTREVLGQYIDDLAAAWIATAELRVFSVAPSRPSPLP